MEIFRPSALKRAKSWTLFIRPRERGIDRVEWIAFERLQVRRDRFDVSTSERPGEGLARRRQRRLLPSARGTGARPMPESRNGPEARRTASARGGSKSCRPSRRARGSTGDPFAGIVNDGFGRPGRSCGTECHPRRGRTGYRRIDVTGRRGRGRRSSGDAPLRRPSSRGCRRNGPAAFSQARATLR